MTSAPSIMENPSVIISGVTVDHSMPLSKLSATLKFFQITAPVFSEIAPFSTFFQLIKS
jgi:hypothetical protein